MLKFKLHLENQNNFVSGYKFIDSLSDKRKKMRKLEKKAKEEKNRKKKSISRKI